jgi:hypothetical protein
MVVLAHAYEQRDMAPPPPSSSRPPARTLSRPAAHSVPQPSPVTTATSSASVAQPLSSVKRLTTAKIAQRRKDGQCFHCNKFFTHDHKKVCKQLFTIEVLDEEVPETPIDSSDPTISIHAITGIRPRSSKIVQLFVDINDVQLTAVLDSGSTHNFVVLEATARAGLQFVGRAGLQVAVTNRD